MQKLYYGSLAVDMTDNAADLLWAYHSALRAQDRSASVEVPVLVTGAQVMLRLTLTPTTSLAILPLPEYSTLLAVGEAEQIERAALDFLRLQLAMLDSEGPSRVA